MKSLNGYFLISGNGYIEGVGPRPGEPPRELYTHRSDRIRPIPGKLGLPSGYQYEVNGKKKNWGVDAITGASPIMHLKTFNPLDDWFGMSPIEAATFAVDTHNQAGAWNKALLDNGGRPCGALVAQGDLDPDERKRLNESLKEHQGAKNAGLPWLLWGGLEWKEMGLSPKDMDYINSKHTSARDIALVYGVPPMMLGIPGDNTYSNYQEARQAFWEETVLPLLDFFLDEFNNGLTPSFGEDLLLAYDEDRVSALSFKREKRWDRVQKADFLSFNEKREAVGYSPVEGGDQVFVRATYVPLVFNASEEPKKALGDGMEYKLLNDATPKQRAREWAVQTRLMASLERSFAPRAARLLKSQAGKSAKAYLEDGVTGAAISLFDHGKEFAIILTAHYGAVMETFGERFFDGIKSGGARETKDDADDAFEKYVKEWMALHTARRVKLLSDETKKLVMKAIEDGEAAGDPVSKIADRIIEKAGSDFAESRAITIARTETHASAVAANDMAAKASGLRLKRVWLSARDANTRDSHSLADGQVRGMDEPFDINGYPLMRPGDPYGPPEEIINCRCVVSYVTEV
jgi:HK97 family phage portal protein